MLKKIKNTSFKKALKAFSIIWVVALIVVMTIANMKLDENFNFLSWISSAMILFGITVYGLLIGESLGKDMGIERTEHDREGKLIGGLYQVSLKEYNEFRASIEPIVIFFDQFFEWWLAQSVRSKNINFLVACNVKLAKAKTIVDYCDEADYWDLRQHAIEKTDEKTGEKVYIKKLNESEELAVKEVLFGRVKIENEDSGYYLSAFADSGSGEKAEESKKIKKQRKFNTRGNRAIRITFGLILSLTMGLLTVGDFMAGNNAQAWFNLISRIATLFTSLMSGWLSGIVDVKLQARELKHKVDILKLFESAYKKHLFSTYDENEEAKAEFEKYQEELQESVELTVDAEENKVLLIDKQ